TMGAPFLTVRGNRSMHNGLMNTGWDDEGVKPEDFTLVDKGVIVDYLALRETASALSSWYTSRKETVRTHGVAASGQSEAPRETKPNITIDPSAADVTVDDMIKDVKRGIYLPFGGVSADFGIRTAYGIGMPPQEIRNGKLVGNLTDLAIQFTTQPF